MLLGFCDFGYLSLVSSILFFETGSPTELGIHSFRMTRWPESFWDSPLCNSQYWGYSDAVGDLNSGLMLVWETLCQLCKFYNHQDLVILFTAFVYFVFPLGIYYEDNSETTS